MSAITITEETIIAMAREAIQKEVSDLRPLLRDEILKSLQLVDEAGALSIFQIGGKDPRRTFRRMANKHKLECVRIDGFKWWKVSAIQALIDRQTLNKRKPDISQEPRTVGTEIVLVGREAA